MLYDGRTVYTPGVSEQTNGVRTLWLVDALGNARKPFGAAAALRSYDAFGQVVSQTSANSSPFGFAADAGYQTDSDSGLTLVGNRYYDAAIGRFLQPDPSGQEENDYAYAANNPLSNDDPDGLQNKPGKGAEHKNKYPKQKVEPTPDKPTSQTGKDTKGGHGDMSNGKKRKDIHEEAEARRKREQAKKGTKRAGDPAQESKNDARQKAIDDKNRATKAKEKAEAEARRKEANTRQFIQDRNTDARVMVSAGAGVVVLTLLFPEVMIPMEIFAAGTAVRAR